MHIDASAAAGGSTATDSPRWQFALAVVVAASGWALLLQLPLWDAHPVLVAGNTVAAAAWAAAGAILADAHGGKSAIRAFISTGFFWAVSWSGAWGSSWPLIAVLGDSVFWTLAAYAMLSFPAGRLQNGVERAYMIAFVLWVMFFDTVVVIVWVRDDMVDNVTRWESWSSLIGQMPSTVGVMAAAGSTALGLGFIVLVFRRWRASTQFERRTLVPFVVAATVAGLGGGPLTWLAVETQWNPAIFTTTLPVLAPPVAFGASAIRRRLLLADLSSRLLRTPTDAQSLDSVLRDVLSDPLAHAMFWVPRQHQYVDGGGHTIAGVDHAHQHSHRTQVVVRATSGRELATLCLDGPADRRDDLVDTVVATGRVMIENTQLRAAVLADLRETRRAQNRILSMDQTDRRRIADDLHDGVQQRLIALLWRVDRLKTTARDESLHAELAEASADLVGTLEELRSLSAGINPTHLGLGPAIENITERLPLPVSVELSADGIPSDIAATAYYVVCESLANATKHANAHNVNVAVSKHGALLRVTVCDDGVGAADPSGRGLTALNDRVRACGGTFEIHSARNVGTTVEARLPCESP